jgi:hypothetical protein
MGSGVLVSIVAVIQMSPYWLCVPLPWPHLDAEQLRQQRSVEVRRPIMSINNVIKTVRAQIIIMLIGVLISHLRNGQIITMLID